MLITSVFFADHVAIYDGKLNVLGGVWTHYTVDAIPASRVLPVAVIAQVSSEDKGVVRRIALTLDGPDHAPSGEVNLEWHVPSEYPSEHLCLALAVGTTITSEGRHVAQVAVDGVPQAALPLHVVLA